ncbi:SAP domain-containing protein [Bacillus cereus]|uniref:SAP domain-containing protein n=1 Tax=Bacillus cereus TaxID=1396 RepID=UPI0006A8109D|nr:SAP domain-containing protein [Bacillus cereus]CUB38333.1 hypothetical protein BN2127_JRS4_02882 [Bacillus cereus]
MDKINRPAFDKRMSIQEFTQHYWYKEELKKICLECNISSHGTKAELERKIKEFLSGKTVVDSRQQNANMRKSVESNEITLETKLIPEGFKFNQKARDFFANYYNVPKFTFTKDMAAALREAERKGDFDMSVKDLIKIYEEGKKRKKNTRIDSPEERTYQWNNFVREFNKDSRTKGMKNKMNIASFLWKVVKTNPGPKEYRKELIDEFLHEIEHLSNSKLQPPPNEKTHRI